MHRFQLIILGFQYTLCFSYCFFYNSIIQSINPNANDVSNIYMYGPVRIRFDLLDFMQLDLYFSDNDLSMRRMGGFLVIFGFISAFIGIFAFAFDCNLPRPGNPATSQHSIKNKYQIVYFRFLFQA